jgi:hypothetical protein
LLSPMSRSSFLHTVHMTASPSLQRVPEGRVPRFLRYYEMLRLPAALLLALRLLRVRIPSCAPVVRSISAEHPRCGLDFLYRVAHPFVIVERRQQDLPSSQGILRNTPYPSDPGGGADASTILLASALLPSAHRNTSASTTTSLSRLNKCGSLLRCVRFT